MSDPMPPLSLSPESSVTEENSVASSTLPTSSVPSVNVDALLRQKEKPPLKTTKSTPKTPQASDFSLAPVGREEIRPSLHMDYDCPLSIPSAVRKDGYGYRWVRKSIERDDDYRLEQMMMKGWTPVPAERYGRLETDPLNRNPLAKKFICYKDVILMERPQLFSLQEEEAWYAHNQRCIKSLKGLEKAFDTPDPVIVPIQDF